MTEFVDSEDWRIKCKNMNDTFAEARKKVMFIDVRFLVGQSSSARYFSAHKMMLACGSPVFEAMLFGQLAEKKDPITIPDDDPEVFEIMLQHLYGECIVFPSIAIACKSYSIGDKYLIPDLRAKAANFIKAFTMSEEHFWEIIEGNHLTNNYIEVKFRSYIALHANKLIRSKEFLHAPEYVMKIFLLVENMSISEYELLSSVTEWCLKNFRQDLESKTQDLLQYIRFSVLKSKEFCLFTEKFPNVLDASTSLKILKHLNDPSSYDLPIWCSTKKVVRKSTVPESPSEPNVPPVSGYRRVGQPSHPRRA